MKKAQALKLWKELSNSTSAKEVISAFANKRGYGGERTLVRYSQAAAGFKEGLSLNVIADKTGWSADYIDKIHAWWKEVFPSEVGPVRQELATRVAPARTEQKPLALSPPLPTFNIGDLKIAPSPIGTKLVKKGPFMKPWEGPPFPAYADIFIRLRVENPSDASITISNISYAVTINGNYAGKGSAPGEYTISPHSEPEIDAPFRADFKTGGSVLISAIMSKKLEIGITGTAHYQSNSRSADKPFSGVIPVTLQLPFQLP